METEAEAERERLGLRRVLTEASEEDGEGLDLNRRARLRSHPLGCRRCIESEARVETLLRSTDASSSRLLLERARAGVLKNAADGAKTRSGNPTLPAYARLDFRLHAQHLPPAAMSSRSHRPSQLASSRGLHRFFRAYVTDTSFLPLADLDSLASDSSRRRRRPSRRLPIFSPSSAAPALPPRGRSSYSSPTARMPSRVESYKSESPALVPVAKQGFDAVVVHACWSRHLPSEFIVLLENGELCLFNLDSCQGGKMRVDLGSKDDCGNWLSCDYGANPWMVIIATSKSVLLVDLRFASRGEYKVVAKVGTPGVFETDLFAGADQQPLKPLLAWQHGLENPNNVAMFRLSELWPSKEHELASKSDQRCSCSNGTVKDVLSIPVSRDGSDPQENKSLTMGYYVLQYDVSMLEPSFAGFALIRLTALGKLEIQRYHKSTDVRDDIPYQRKLNGLPSNILRVTFSKYKDMVACSGERAAEHLDVPSLMRNGLRPFLLAKPSSISENLTSKVLRRDPLVGPVLPIHVLLAMEQRNKDVESSSQDALDEIDLVSDQCREVLEAFDHVISIADSFGSQGVDDEKSYFAYEPRIEIRFSSDSARKNRKGDQNPDDPLHTSTTTNQDKIFTTFVCGKTEIPEPAPEQAAASILDIGPCLCRFHLLGDTEIQLAPE
ncbi:hypothetical protein PR202_ga21970 [Eleusine coracana subsp. coracana]|uniref:Uncharacterized protein n=1 Tax=Eleusine coracana subsp. coracana TaxID=191504 RepID=A0AAV5D2B0_ELECO|nr:hypothetical protein PR202_ga21970 [Eleusine coracana subsp. coracana]